MSALIKSVTPRSVADRIGLQPDDEILRIGGEELIDEIDYQALTYGEEFTMEVRKSNGEIRLVTVRKHAGDSLGLTIDESAALSPRPCKNHCVFCFIDQMPPGMRKTLYVKDDDWRLSLMMGNFITMTNIDEAEIKRVVRRHATPLYISVQATDPELRVRLLRNPNAGQLMDKLRYLKEHGISYHCQVVLCPGLNDGEQLTRTLTDLASLRPAALSVALVPVGLTKFREGLFPVQPYTAETAAALLDMIQPLQQRFLSESGTRFVFPSDEFYCLSGRSLPEEDEYENFPQIENGVGMLRCFESDLRDAAEELERPKEKKQDLVIACGTSVAAFMREMAARYAPNGTTIRVIPILNRFFGESVTVTGLITGQDLVSQLSGVSCERILICRNMLREDGDLFLDGMSLEEVRSALPAPLTVIPNTGIGFLRGVYGY